MLCPQCQAPIRETARFCPSCGARAGLVGSTLGAITAPDPTITRPLAEVAFEPGTLLGDGGRYRVARRIGGGGFGEVFLAFDTRLGRTVVAKRLMLPRQEPGSDSRQQLASLRREAELLVSLNHPGHPGIPEIYEYLPESRCLVMKHIDGETLDSLVTRGGALLEEQALRYAHDVCSALAYMHGRAPEPVLHRDVKPPNILLDAESRVWLIDFGLSKSLPAEAELGRGGDSSTAGTLGFTPFEQWRGQPEPRSDVYALGATLHFMLTGYAVGQTEALAILSGQASLPPLRALRPGSRPDVERLVARATAFELVERPSARELLAELRSLLDARVLLPPPPPAQPPDDVAPAGREAELADLAARLGRDGLAALVGPPGLGKTTLAAEAARRARAGAPLLWHTLRPEACGEGMAWALAALLAFHGQEETWRRLQTSRLAGAAPPHEVVADYLSEGFAALAGQVPALVCMDEAHLAGADPLGRRLLLMLVGVAQRGQARLLLAGRVMPEGVPGAAAVRLGGLALAGARALIGARAAGDEARLATLVRVTGGNPQLLLLSAEALGHNAGGEEELLARLAASGDIERYLLQEVDAGLEEQERAALVAVAALLDRGGTRAAVEAAADAGDLRRTLAALAGRGLLTAHDAEEGRTYALHAILRAFFYEQPARRDRRAMHARAAAHYAGPDERDALLAARHYELAGEHALAAAQGAAAVDAAVGRGEALALAQLLGRLPPRALDPGARAVAGTARAELLALLGAYDEAGALLAQAVSDGEAAGDAAAQARRWRLQALTAERTGDYARAEACCHAGLALLAGGLEAARLHEQLAAVLMRRAAYDAAEEACAAGLAALPPEWSGEGGRERAALRKRLATLAGQRGRYAEAIEALEETLLLARAAGDPLLLGATLNNLGVYCTHTGRLDAALAHYAESLALKERAGDVEGRVSTLINRAVVLQMRGAYDEALASLAEARSLGERFRLREPLAWTLDNIGFVHLLRGEAEPAVAPLQQALALFRELGDGHGEADALYRLGDAALALGDGALALERGQAALALARQLGSAALVPCALRVSGEALALLGRQGEAAAALDEAWALQAQVGDPFDETLLLAALARHALAAGDAALAAERAGAGLETARSASLPYQEGLLAAILSAAEGRRSAEGGRPASDDAPGA